MALRGPEKNSSDLQTKVCEITECEELVLEGLPDDDAWVEMRRDVYSSVSGMLDNFALQREDVLLEEGPDYLLFKLSEIYGAVGDYERQYNTYQNVFSPAHGLSDILVNTNHIGNSNSFLIMSGNLMTLVLKMMDFNNVLSLTFSDIFLENVKVVLKDLYDYRRRIYTAVKGEGIDEESFEIIVQRILFLLDIYIDIFEFLIKAEHAGGSEGYKPNDGVRNAIEMYSIGEGFSS